MPGRTTSVAFLGNSADLDAVANRVAEKLRQTAVVAEESNAKVAASAEASAAKLGEAYTAGTSKAAAGLSKLSALGASFGVPMTKSLDAVGQKLDETSAKHQKLLGTMAQAGKMTLGAGLAGFAAAAYEGTKGAMALQTAMERLHTQAGASQGEVKSMTSAVMNMAGALRTSPTGLADSLYHVESAGFRGQQALNIMSTAAKEAKVSGADLTDTTTALTAAVFSGIKGAQNYAQAMGLLNATVGAGDMKFQDLNEAFAGPMLATVKGYGLSLKDVGAALATFGDLNIRGADAATQLRMAVQYMAKPAATAGPLLKELGLNVHSFADAMANGGLMPALQLLHDKLQAAGVQGNQMAQVIGDLFTKKGAAGVTILENSLSKLDSKQKLVAAGTNQLKSSWDAYTQTAQSRADQLKASVQALGDKFGTFLIPKLIAVAGAIQSVIAWMEKHKAVAEALGGVIAGVLGTAIAAYAYTKAVAFVNATKAMVGAMGSLVSGIASGVQAILQRLGLMSAASETTAAQVGAADTQLEASNTAAAASFTAFGATVDSEAAAMAAAMDAFAADVATADAGIEASNAAAGASFTALLGPIGAATAALAGFGYYFATNNPGTGAVTVNGQTLRNPHLALGAGTVSPNFGAGLTSSSGLPSGYGGGALGAFFGGNQITPIKGIPIPSSGTNAQKIAGALAAQGFSKNAIAGILGNFAQETGGGTLAGINTRDSGTGASGMGGMGIAQWTGGRRAAEMNYAAAHGLSPTDLTAQIGFLIQELRTNYHGAFTAIQGASSPAQAAALFNKLFEGGTDPNSIRERVAASLGGGGGGGATKGLSTSQLDALLNSASSKSASAKAIKTLLYANPFPQGATVGRTDMGLDFSAAPGTPIDAIGAGVVKAIINNWYKGQPLIEEQLTQGPNKGQYIYYAEQIRSAVHLGEQLRAGQQIGTVAPSGTGLELGFGGPGGKTLAQATTGYTEGQVTPAGKAFASFFKSIGSGVYTTTYNGVTTGGGSNYGVTAAQAIQQFIQSLQKASNALIQTYQTLEQSGTVRTLTRALGVRTSGTMPTSLTYGGGPITGGLGSAGMALLGAQVGQVSIASQIRTTIEGASTSAIEKALNAGNNPTALDKALIPILEKASANSQATKNFNALVAELRGSGQTGQANALISARGGVFATLAQEMYAQQVLKDGESLNLQATQEKDRTQLATDTAQDQLNVQKAYQQQALDQIDAQTTAIKDMTQTVQDQFAGIVQAIQDATTQMADASSAVVQGLSDQTQIQVDLLGERGLYGLNLIAQRLQVQLDTEKAGYDQQINAAKLNLDQVTTTAHAAEQTAQLNLDSVTTQQDQLIALAQSRADQVATVQQLKILHAQQHLDQVTLHNDVAVVGPAQTAVDLGATLPKAQQDVLNASLRRAQGQEGTAVNTAQGQYQGVYDAAQSAINVADNAVSMAQQTAQQIIQGAQLTLTTVTGQGNQAIAVAQESVQAITDTANQAEQPLQSLIDVVKATASTQFAGTGAQVNIYGADLSNPSAVSDATSWALRTLIQVPATT